MAIAAFRRQGIGAPGFITNNRGEIRVRGTLAMPNHQCKKPDDCYL
jgi:hypothetical protein